MPVHNRQQGHPVRAALQHGRNWSASYIKEQELPESTSKTAMTVYSPRRRVPLSKSRLWLHGKRIKHVSGLKYLGPYIDDRIS